MMGTILVRHEPASAAAVRRELALDLDLHGVPTDAVDDVMLVASELVGNAVRHGVTPGNEGRWTVEWTVQPNAVLISVDDPNDAEPVLRHPAPDAPSGRGLAIVSALSNAWGVERHSDGKRVWARVRIG
jgi:anti-sigma regulatory factor (Ser/Thr protein kinase)